MNKITQESGGRIQFQTFWRSTLISQHSAIEELEAGVADVAVIHPTFTRAGMHGIKGQMSFYAGVQDRETAEAIFWHLWKSYPELSNELANVKLIAAHSGTPMFIQTVDKPVNTLEDMNDFGLKPLLKKFVR